MPKQTFGQLNIDFKNSIRLKKNEINEIRKKLLKKKLKKKKNTK